MGLMHTKLRLGEMGFSFFEIDLDHGVLTLVARVERRGSGDPLTSL